MRLVPLNMFNPSSDIFTDSSKAVLLLWILFVSCLSLFCCIVCSLQPNDYLLGGGGGGGQGWPLVCDVYIVCVTIPYSVPGQVWYLIVSIHDLCKIQLI